jgi:hypothetical protein
MPFPMITLLLLLLQQPPIQVPAQTPQPGDEAKPVQKSAYLAFVDHDYIFTLEMVKAGIPLLNFVSMADKDQSLAATQVRLTLDNRKVPGRFLIVDTGSPDEPVTAPSLKMRPRSSFGVRLQGEFGGAREVWGATIGLENEDLKLVPLSSVEFENLVLKVNRINLGSPDFTDDWKALKLEQIGTRTAVRRRVTGRP